MAVVASACTGGSAEQAATTTTEAERTTVTVPESATTTSTTSSTTATTPPPDCATVDITSGGSVGSTTLIEASGLVASGRTDGLLWATNDSGQPTGLHALDLDGTDRGFFPLVDPAGNGIDAADIEDLAIVGDRIYLADIGDNLEAREQVSIWIAGEPDPTADNRSVTAVARLDLTYADGPRDAEAMLLDPRTGTVILLDKDIDGDMTRIYQIEIPGLSVQLDTPPGAPIVTMEAEADFVGSFDATRIPGSVAELTAAAVLFPSAVTAADISTDGSLIAVRTYGTVLVFNRPPGSSVADALLTEPCQTGTARESQGESLAILPGGTDDGFRYVTTGEGEGQPVNLVTVTPTR